MWSRGFEDGLNPVPIGIVIHPAGRRAWVAHTSADVIAEIDPETWRGIRLLREPDKMDYSPVVIEKERDARAPRIWNEYEPSIAC